MVYGNWHAALESKAALTTIDIQIVSCFGTFVKSATGAKAEAPAFIGRLREQLRAEVQKAYDRDGDLVTAAWRDEDSRTGEVFTIDLDERAAVIVIDPFDDEAWDQVGSEAA